MKTILLILSFFLLAEDTSHLKTTQRPTDEVKKFDKTQFYFPFTLSEKNSITKGFSLVDKVAIGTALQPNRIYLRINRDALSNDGTLGRREWILSNNDGEPMGALPLNYIVTGTALGFTGADAQKRFSLNQNSAAPWVEVSNNELVGLNGNPWILNKAVRNSGRYTQEKYRPFLSFIHNSVGTVLQSVRGQRVIIVETPNGGKYYGFTDQQSKMGNGLIPPGVVVSGDMLGLDATTRWQFKAGNGESLVQVSPLTQVTFNAENTVPLEQFTRPPAQKIIPPPICKT